MKATALAPTNIAFIKYWGRKDELLRLPANGSLSMNIDRLTTTTTVEFSDMYTEDDITVNGEKEKTETARVSAQLDRIRALGHIRQYAKVVSVNTFPTGTGLSSSASGFAALSLAGITAAGISLPEKELTILARKGSGSACRSIPDGFVEWLDGDTDETSYAYSVFPHDYWDMRDIVAITSTCRKDVPTSEGQRLAQTSPFYDARIRGMEQKLSAAKTYIRERNFSAFGKLIEEEALNMHAVMITSDPALLYWTPETISLLKEIHAWRTQGLEAYFTINTGQDVHILCKADRADDIKNALRNLPYVRTCIVNSPCRGAHTIPTPLF